MRALGRLWPPPAKEKGGQEKDLGALECANPSGIGKENCTRVVPMWQCGLPAELVERIGHYRQSQPLVALPADVQRQIGRNWIEHARGTR